MFDKQVESVSTIGETCCFTGNRPQKLAWGYDESDVRCVELKLRITAEIEKAIDKGYNHFISGMAQGFDTYCAEIVLELMKTNKNITLEVAIPCEGQSSKWYEEDKARYFLIISKATKETMVTNQYTKYSMQLRNKYMVANSSLVIAYNTSPIGGTASTITYAQKLNRIVVVL